MGTNYYLTVTKGFIHKKSTQYHIGLSSAGWRFNFHFIDCLAESVEAWQEFTKIGKIKDEYDRAISYKTFWRMVQNKQKERRFLDGQFYYAPNPRTNFQIDEYDFTKGEFC
jgi:hypothetical protein